MRPLCYISKELKKDSDIKDIIKDKNDNDKNIINKIYFMTKERKLNCFSLPNKLYKKNHCIVTKLRKSYQKNNDNINILSRKNDNIKNKNNNICLITKERKMKSKKEKEILLPLIPKKYITKERKILLNNKSILLPTKDICLINKVRKKENMNQIKTIQNIIKTKNSKNKIAENKNKDLYDNEEKTAFMPRKKFYFKNIDDSDFDDDNLEKDNYYMNGYIS